MTRSVLVSGSARRIGRRIALDLAGDGWDVAVHCNTSIIEAEEVAGLITAMGRKAVIVRGDHRLAAHGGDRARRSFAGSSAGTAD